MAHQAQEWWMQPDGTLPYCDEDKAIDLDKLNLQLHLTEPANERLLVKYNTLRWHGLYEQLKPRLKSSSPLLSAQIKAFNKPINLVQELMEIEGKAGVFKRDITQFLAEINSSMENYGQWKVLLDMLASMRKSVISRAQDYLVSLDHYASSCYEYQSRCLDTINALSSKQGISSLETLATQENRDEIERRVFPLRIHSELYFWDWLTFNNAIAGYNELTYLMHNLAPIMERKPHPAANLLTEEETDLLFDEMKRFYSAEMDRIYGPNILTGLNQ